MHIRNHLTKVIHGICLVLVFVLSGLAYAAGPVVMVAPHQSPDIQRVVDTFKQHLPVTRVVYYAIQAPTQNPQAIIVPLGPKALKEVLIRQPQARVLALLVASHLYWPIINGIPRSQAQRVTAIFTDPSPANQLKLIAQIYKPEAPTTAIISRQNRFMAPMLRRAAKEVGLSDFRLHRIKPSDKIINVLPKLPANSIVLALPDTELYNPYTLLTIIEDIYKHQQILIGFAPGFVKYGALAAPYSDNADIAAQAGEVLRGMQRSLATPKTQYPKYFRIVVNENVAKIRGANIQITESRPPRR